MDASRNMEDDADQEGKKRCFPYIKLPRSRMGKDDLDLDDGPPSTEVVRDVAELLRNYELAVAVSAGDEAISWPDAQTKVRKVRNFLDFGREQEKKMDALALREDEVKDAQKMFEYYA